MSTERGFLAALRTAAGVGPALGSAVAAVGAVGWAQHARLAGPALSAADQSLVTAGYALARFGVSGVPGGRRRFVELAPVSWYGTHTGAFERGLPAAGRGLMLLATLVAAALLWLLARRLLLGPLTAALAVLLFGLPPFALRAHQVPDAAALALPWLLAALLVIALLYPPRAPQPAVAGAEPAGDGGASAERDAAGEAAADAATDAAGVPADAAAEPKSYFEAVVPAGGSWVLTAIERSTRTGRSGLSAARGDAVEPPPARPEPESGARRHLPYRRIAGWTLAGAFLLVAILTDPVAGAPVTGNTVVVLGWPFATLGLAIAADRGWRELARARTPEGHLLPIQVGLGVTVFAVLAIVVLLARDAWRTPRTGADPAQRAADEAAHWLLTNADGQRVAADDLTWVALVRGGYPPDRVLSAGGYGPTPAPDGLRLVVADPLRADSVAAPARPALASSLPQARFAVAGSVREVRYVVSDPAAVARTLLRQRLACQLAGVALAGNPRLALAPAADLLLRAGDVDPRLLTALAGIVAGHRLHVEDFPAVPGEEGTQVMRRVARLGEVDGAPAGTSSRLRDWLTAQLAPYRPSAITTDRDALVIRYDPPTPVGLLLN